MSKKDQRIRQLRDAAVAAIASRKFEEALASYTELTKLEPEDGSWLQRMADCHRRLNQRQQELGVLLKAALVYQRNGFALKAVALCKVALAIDPKHVVARRQLAEVLAHKSRSPKLLKRPAASNASQPRAAAQVPPQDSGPALPLSSVSLLPKLPDAKHHETSHGIYELVLDSNKLVPPNAVNVRNKGAPRSRIERTLARTPLFGEVDASLLPTLIDRVETVHLDEGQVLFQQGDACDGLYVVVDGEMVARRKGVELGRFDEGDFFGEIDLLSDQPRQAMLGATRATLLLRLDRALINELIDSWPGFLDVMLGFLRARLVRTLMLTSPLFASLPAAQQAKLGRQFKFLEIEPNTPVVEQGVHSRGLFILLAGRAVVTREDREQVHQVGKLGAGDLFGEMSLLGETPANATVTILSRSFALYLPARKFHDLMTANPRVLQAVQAVAHERQAVLDAIGCPDGRADLIWIRPVSSLQRKPGEPGD